MDLAREDLPRVSVETLQDWQLVKSHYVKAALTKLDAQIIASGLARDRDMLHFHMNKFIENTFTMAQPNLRVNGRNFEEIDGNEEETEPFDEGLDRHIWSLSDQRLHWDRQIANKRRNKPIQKEKLFQGYLNQQRKDAIEEMRMLSEESNMTWNDKIHAASDERELEDTFEKTSALVQELNQSIPTEQERSERIVQVETEVIALKP